MALPLIHMNVLPPKDEDAALKQLAAFVVAQAFNDYMTYTMHGSYVEQVRRIEQSLYEWRISEGEEAEAAMYRTFDLMKGNYFGRIQKLRKGLMRKHLTEEQIAHIADKIDKVANEEDRRERTSVPRELYRLDQFFHGKLFGLYSGEVVDLDEALAHCANEIEKEKERIR